MKWQTKSSRQTKKKGELLAQKILKSKNRKSALVLGLVGNLGGGKTTFLQGFAKGLGVKEKILSPTFVILKRFDISSLFFRNFFHLDCYRIEKLKEILEMDFKNIINDPKNIVAVEWADKILKIMPQDTLWLKFRFQDKENREIALK